MCDTNFFIPDESLRADLIKKTAFGVYNAEIHTALLTESDLNNFWLTKRDETVTGLLYNNGDNFLLSAFDFSFYEDVKRFAEFSHAKFFASNEELLKTGLPENKIYTLDGSKALRSDNVPCLTNREIQQMYLLLSGKKSISHDEELRYIRLIKAKNRSLAAVFGIKQDSTLISCAAVSASNEDICIISNVFTVPEYRNKGLAGECVKACVNFAKKQNKTPFVFCEEKNLEFYKKLNFSQNF